MEVPLTKIGGEKVKLKLNTYLSLQRAEGTYSQRNGLDFNGFVRAYRKITCGPRAVHKALWGGFGYMTVGMSTIMAYTYWSTLYLL
jgi:hypothetical protein